MESKNLKLLLAMNIKYHKNNLTLYLEDTFIALKNIPDESIDCIFADPPYFLSNDGISCQGGKMISVNKGDWDKTIDKYAFNKEWITECFRILKPTGTIFISGTLHNIYSVGYILEKTGFKIINNLTWEKTNPPPNLACKCFTHSTETILWAAKKGKKYFFNYKLMKSRNGGKQAKDVIRGSLTKKSEKIFGKHPTQKPLYLLEQLILAATQENDLVLDPFCGTSTTGVICKRYHRGYIGIDNNEEFLNISIRRLENE